MIVDAHPPYNVRRYMTQGVMPPAAPQAARIAVVGYNVERDF
jgi:hypothetical protein